jgi:hypothetical protein
MPLSKAVKALSSSLPQRACLCPDLHDASTDAASCLDQEGVVENKQISPCTHLAFSTSSRETHIDSSLGEPLSLTFVFLLGRRPDAANVEDDRLANSGGLLPPSRTTHWTRYVFRICENTCRTSPARSILTRRRAPGRAVSTAFERVSRGGDSKRQDNKLVAVSLSSEADIEVDTSGDVGNS